MATDVSVRIVSTTNHGNLRFSPRVQSGPVGAGPLFCAFAHNQRTRHDKSVQD